MSAKKHGSWPGLIEHYRRHLDVTDSTPIVTLLEGNTPLLRCDRLARELGVDVELYVKFEAMNPTASFKDRGMTMAITKAVEEGAKAVICASTGNTSASAAAYAARAGIKAFVVVPHGNIAKGKLSQAVMHGARVLSIEGSFDHALNLVRAAAQRYPVTLVNSINPHRIEGQKTAAFEVCDALGRAPTYHFLPVGNAGNITAYWRGYREYADLGVIRERPRMMGFQASGAAPIVRGYAIEKPETIATAIRIGNPASWEHAVAARDESGGVIGDVSDEEIITAYQALGRLEGVFCEPASAASVAGVVKQSKGGLFRSGDVVVCTLTGHGLKDPDTALKQVGEPAQVPPSLDRLAEFLELK
jgi:threonine synthase